MVEMVDFEKLYIAEQDTLLNDIKDIVKISFCLITNKGLTQYINFVDENIVKLKVMSLMIILVKNKDCLECEVNQISDLLEDDIFIKKFEIHEENLIKQFDYIVQNKYIINSYNEERNKVNYVSKIVRDLKDTFSFYDGLWRE